MPIGNRRTIRVFRYKYCKVFAFFNDLFFPLNRSGWQAIKHIEVKSLFGQLWLKVTIYIQIYAELSVRMFNERPLKKKLFSSNIHG